MKNDSHDYDTKNLKSIDEQKGKREECKNES